MGTIHPPVLSAEHQNIFLHIAQQEDKEPRQVLDTLIEHFIIERSRHEIQAGKGIPHAQVIENMRQKYTGAAE